MSELEEYTDSELKKAYCTASWDKEQLFDERNRSVQWCSLVRDELKKREIDTF